MNGSQQQVNSLDIDFAAAAKNWYLERLHIDLAAAKGRALTPLEKKFLKGLLCGCSPAEIALKVYQTPNSSAVRVYLSSGLYKYIRELFSRQRGESIELKNWSHVTNWLAKAGYKKEQVEETEVEGFEVLAVPSPEKLKVQEYLSRKKPVSGQNFCGREGELAQLQQWIVRDRARLVSILGMEGMGKTRLAAQFVRDAEGEFERVVWRSLADFASLSDLLADAIATLAAPQEVKLPPTTHAQISLLMERLRSQRCLFVLDGVEAIVQRGQRAGLYRHNFTAFGELLKRLSSENHGSCCLLTSQEKPRELFFLEAESSFHPSLSLEGLQLEEALQLPEIQALADLRSHKQSLVRLYGSNPLLLKIAAIAINKFFNSKIAEFLATGTVVFGEIRDLLDRQFDRLWQPEQRVLYNLSLSQCLGELQGFARDFPLGVSSRERLEALESLQRRMLIEKSAAGFRPKTLLHTYLLEKIIEQICTQASDRYIAYSIEKILRKSLFGNSLADPSFPLSNPRPCQG